MHHVLPVIAYRRTQAFVGDAHKLTIFDQLTPTEYVEVLDYLYAHPTLDLTCKYSAYFFMNATEGMPCKMPYTAATWNRANWLTKLELDPPNKAQTLAYLAGTGPRPARYAKFHFMRGARTPRDSVLMKVGPLPISTLAARSSSSTSRRSTKRSRSSHRSSTTSRPRSRPPARPSSRKSSSGLTPTTQPCPPTSTATAPTCAAS